MKIKLWKKFRRSNTEMSDNKAVLNIFGDLKTEHQLSIKGVNADH